MTVDSLFFATTFVFVTSLSLVQSLCLVVPETSIICINQAFNPKDILHKRVVNKMDVIYRKMEGSTNLSVPEELSVPSYENIIIKRFYIEYSCVQHIEDGYFVNIDRNNSELVGISFKEVKCLQRLSSKSFRGIGGFVKVLSFDVMPDLIEIDADFFDLFSVLKKLTITNTSIKVMAQDLIVKMPKVAFFDVSNNLLTTFPTIPSDRKDLISKITAINNPFHCQCSLQPFMKAMKHNVSSNMYNLYKCSTPDRLAGKNLFEVDLCSPPSEPIRETTKKSLDKEDLNVTDKQARTLTANQKIPDVKIVATAKIRVEIIIAASLIVLVVVVVVLVVVLYKRHKVSKKHTIVYEQNSPSKIVFQNESDQSRPFMYKYDT